MQKPIPTFTYNASKEYANFFRAVIECCHAHVDVFNYVLSMHADETADGDGTADGVSVYLTHGWHTADSYAAFVAALRQLPDELPDGYLSVNIFPQGGEPMLKLWFD